MTDPDLNSRKASACSTSYDVVIHEPGYPCRRICLLQRRCFLCWQCPGLAARGQSYFLIHRSSRWYPFRLNGQSWGGVILDDKVQSSYDAYALNGHQNGYVMPTVSSVVDSKGTEGDIVFQNGIRTPGFFNLPICDDIPSAVPNTICNSPSEKYWPCTNSSGYNLSGTNLVWQNSATKT